MSVTVPDTDDRPRLASLSAFQRDILWVLAHGGPLKGLAVQEALADYYDERVNHGRLYQNLDALAEAGYIEKSARDDRTNEYALTADAKQAMQRRRTWVEADEVVTV